MNWEARMICWTLVSALFACNSTAAAQGVVDERYQLPLVGSYGVYRDSDGYERDAGRYRLVRMERFKSGTIAYSDVVKKLSQVAVSGRLIVGQSDGGWFLLDTAAERYEAETYVSEVAWRSALAAAGVPQGIQLATPDSLAAAVPDMILRPWQYQMMGGRFGWSDAAWSLAVQIAGAVVALMLGLVGGSVISTAVGVTIVVDLIAFFFMTGGGPEVILALIFYPFFYGIFVLLGRGLRVIVHRPAMRSLLR